MPVLATQLSQHQATLLGMAHNDLDLPFSIDGDAVVSMVLTKLGLRKCDRLVIHRARPQQAHAPFSFTVPPSHEEVTISLERFDLPE